MFDDLLKLADDPVRALEAVPTERIEADLLTLSGHIAAATCSFLLMLAEFDRREAYESWECLSSAHWLNWKCGVGLSAGREQVRVARRLVDLPLLRAEFSVGRISYSKVKAITRVATSSSEAGLVEMARWATASQLDRACRVLRRTNDLAEAEAELRGQEDAALERRSLTWSRRDGQVVIHARLGEEDAELVLRAIAAALDPPADGRPEGHELDRRRADSLVAMAAAYVANPRAPSAESPAVGAAPAPVPEVVVHVDAAAAVAWARGPSAAPEAARCDGAVPWPVTTSSGAPLSFAALERLLCDAGSRCRVRFPDGSELDAGRRRRTPSPAQRRALLARDRHCRFPGCDRRTRLRAHHVIWWSRGGTTDLQNLIMLCAKHHRAVHEGGWELVGAADSPTFTAPERGVIEPAAPELSGSAADLVDLHRRHGVDVALEGAGGGWCGDRIDWDCFFAAFANDPARESVREQRSGELAGGRGSSEEEGVLGDVASHRGDP